MANSGMCAAKGRRRSRHAGKRNVQNQRTYNNVTKRREAHAKSHGMNLQQFLGLFNVRSWLTRPTRESKTLS